MRRRHKYGIGEQRSGKGGKCEILKTYVEETTTESDEIEKGMCMICKMKR